MDSRKSAMRFSPDEKGPDYPPQETGFAAEECALIESINPTLLQHNPDPDDGVGVEAEAGA